MVSTTEAATTTTSTTSRHHRLADLPAYVKGQPIPSFFFAHGSPTMCEESGGKFDLGPGYEQGPDGPLVQFLKDFGPFLQETYAPKAIVVISAHWETQRNEPIQIAQNTGSWQTDNLLYDYYNFPDAMYKLKFASTGDESISQSIKRLLDDAEIPNEILRDERGLDHGCFLPFRVMFGESCSIPIIEISQFSDLEGNFRLGRALAPLASQGVLLLAGGLTIHTFQDLGAFNPQTAKQGYKDFEDGLKRAVRAPTGHEREKQLVLATQHPYYRLAHPHIEHLTPIAVAAGAGMHGEAVLISDLHGAISVAFGV